MCASVSVIGTGIATITVVVSFVAIVASGLNDRIDDTNANLNARGCNGTQRNLPTTDNEKRADPPPRRRGSSNRRRPVAAGC